MSRKGNIFVPNANSESGGETVTGSDINDTKRGVDVISFNGVGTRAETTSTANIADGAEFSTGWIQTTTAQIAFRVSSDQDLDVYTEFSIDGATNDSPNLPPYKYKAGTIQPPHKLEVIAKFWRIRIENNSGSDTTSMRFQALEAAYGALTSPVNSTVGQNADAEVVRQLPSDVEIAARKFDGWSLVPKFGKNSDIDTGSVPEDVIETGGAYTGFPDNATPQRMYLVSTDAGDTGDVTFIYLASSTATAYSSATVTMNGTTAVDTGVDGIRSHSMRYNNGNASTFNAGTISLQNAASSPTVTWLTIIPERSQSNYAVYTVPAGSTGFIKRIHGSIRRSTSATVDGALWFRLTGESPRLRRPFTIGQTSRLNDEIYGGLRVPEGSDISLRILASTATNVEVSAGFDLILIRNI